MMDAGHGLLLSGRDLPDAGSRAGSCGLARCSASADGEDGRACNRHGDQLFVIVPACSPRLQLSLKSISSALANHAWSGRFNLNNDSDLAVKECQTCLPVRCLHNRESTGKEQTAGQEPVMMNNALRRFVEDVLDRRQINEDDVKHLHRDVMPEGASTQDEIDVLVALDRAVPGACEAFGDWLTATTVDYAVWQCRPTGHVTRDQAHWLTATLGVGEGPTATASRIAFEIVREAESCDQTLVTFAMRRDAARGRAACTSMLDRAALVS
jgi:hypothetical protein